MERISLQVLKALQRSRSFSVFSRSSCKSFGKSRKPVFLSEAILSYKPVLVLLIYSRLSSYPTSLQICRDSLSKLCLWARCWLWLLLIVLCLSVFESSCLTLNFSLNLSLSLSLNRSAVLFWFCPLNLNLNLNSSFMMIDVEFEFWVWVRGWTWIVIEVCTQLHLKCKFEF